MRRVNDCHVRKAGRLSEAVKLEPECLGKLMGSVLVMVIMTKASLIKGNI